PHSSTRSGGPPLKFHGPTDNLDKMRATIIKSVAVSVPLAIGVVVGLVSLAVRNQQPDWNAWISMAVGIGVLAGVFFGLLAGFMRTSHLFK
nr:hypothetical protein [Actinomycetota bacterium]